jgi:hypothetical protein
MNTFNQPRVWISAILFVLLAVHAPSMADNHPPVELGTPFTNGMVLQRGMPVPVWGWTTPGNTVTVEFAGQKKQAIASKGGKWMVKLDPLEASDQPKGMLILGGEGRAGLSLGDILIGEVWIASGQSNMQWLASKCDVGRVLQAGIKERVDAGQEKPPIIREAKVTDVFSALHPIEKAQGAWIDDGANMSAIAYAFAYELWKELGVPIGILNCSFSSTAIEAWTPREGFANSKLPYTQSIHRKLLESDPSAPEHKAAWDKFYLDIEAAIQDNELLIENRLPANPVDLETPGNLKGNRDATWLYNARMHPMVPYAVRGAIWNQGYANSGGGLDYYANLHSLVRGWRLMWQRPDLPVYFHQFYTAKGAVGMDTSPSFSSVSEMRLGTAMARDIPNTGMASQIDIGGSIHYTRKALPGQRLALHALKNQYPSTKLRAGGLAKDIAADGPFIKSYEVNGNKLTVSFDHAEGGLFVGQVETDNKLPATIVKIEGGEKDLGLFYLVGADRVWHQASVKIIGDKIELTAPGVAKPRGVSYATPGVGFQPNIYNNASLPLTPFAIYDNAVVTKATWPDDPPKVDGVELDPSAGGMVYEYRKMPLLSTQFRDNAVLQHGKPLVIWGAAIHNWGPEHHAKMVGDGKEVIEFSFGDIKKTIEVKPGMKEWSVTLGPLKPTDQPRTLAARYFIDGELIHERVAENVVVGDVWYVAASASKINLPSVEPSNGVVRVIKRKAKRDRFSRPSRYSVAVSTTPKNRFASEWLDVQAKGADGQLGHYLASKVDHPVGVIWMQNSSAAPLKSWLPFEALAEAPSLAEDYRILGAGYPGSPSYNANLRRYIKDWKAYWSDYIPEMIETKRVPDGLAWGTYPVQASKNESSVATQSYNVMAHSFTPATLKGVLYFAGEEVVSDAHFAEQKPVLQSSWRERFGGDVAVHVIPAANDVKSVAESIDQAGK